jgi:recombination protein RecR
MNDVSLLKQLVDALQCLPSVGARTAQRMAFHLLEQDRQGGLVLATVLQAAIDNISHCQQCRTLTEETLCRICADLNRDPHKLCVVENPSDVLAIEKATTYRGYYFVLMGKLSPIDGIGPDELGLERLETQLEQGCVKELILATNPSVEGELTAHYINELARKQQIETYCIAQGVPIGGELDYIDSGTLSHAFEGRRKYV